MDKKELKRRLDALNRKPVEKKPKSAILYRRDHPSPRPHRPQPKPSLFPLALQDAVKGEEVKHSSGDKAFVIESPVSKLEEIREPPCLRLKHHLDDPLSNVRQWIDLFCDAARIDLKSLLFLDLETTGLSSTPLFLIGTMCWEGEGLVVRQLFARDYSEEKGVLRLFHELAQNKRFFVSFNGKTFDVPYVQARAAANGVSSLSPSHHLDLLHVSRRIWKRRLPNCKLQTLEQYVCGRNRLGDIPGSDIPRAYHDFVRTGDAWEMVECLKHNMLDLVTLADLMVRLPPP